MPNVKTGKRMDIKVIFELFMLDNKTKEMYSVISLKLKKGKTGEKMGMRCSRLDITFLERECVRPEKFQFLEKW